MERHKTRLNAEFVKSRVRRKCATVEDLRLALAKERRSDDDTSGENNKSKAVYPRWIRINNIVSTLDKELATTFSAYKPTPSLTALSVPETRDLYVDEHIPDLVAVSPSSEFTSSEAYKKGQIIFQDKASCFPAYLLLGNPKGEEEPWEGDIIDACAAPGNKTTHLASILSSSQQYGKTRKSQRPKIFSMDSSAARSKTLQQMVALARANDAVEVLPRQDFLATKPDDERFQNVTALLLDPSCSGSGIVKRDDTPKLALPGDSGQSTSNPNSNRKASKKRKRNQKNIPTNDPVIAAPTPIEEEEQEEDSPNVQQETADKENRLTKLSNLQLHIIEHAFTFPSAKRITYSTCSIQVHENESVIARALASGVAKRRGWRVLRREEQVEGLRRWEYRGVENGGTVPGPELSGEEREGTIRCWADGEEGTGGFFVAGFVRDEGCAAGDENLSSELDEEEEWEGFSSD